MTPVLRTLRTGDASRPRSVSIVHPGALPSSVYDGLAGRLPIEYGIHLLNLQGLAQYQQAALTGGRSELSVVDIAEFFARRVREVLRPGEDHALVGWSFGGVIAHAMTAHLTAGTAPTQLVLLDSIAAVPGYQAQIDDLDEQTLLRWFAMYLGAKRGAPAQPGAACPGSLEDVLAAMTDSGVLLPGTTIAGLAKVFAVYVDGLRRNSLLTRAFQAVPSQIATTVVRARRSLLAESGPMGWDQVCSPSLQVLTGEGDHYSMLTDAGTTALVAGIVRSVLTPTEREPVARHLAEPR